MATLVQANCFSTAYGEARVRFLRAAGSAGGVATSYRLPNAQGGADLQLFTDVVTLGPANARKSMVVLSGVHGTEGLAGSAIQLGALKSGVCHSLPNDTNVVFIHALNPWGMAHDSRTTENNVDLNRNFVDFNMALPLNPGYAPLHCALCPDDIVAGRRELHEAMNRLDNGARGFPQSIDAIFRGQYDYADGINFGGRAEEWSNKIFRKIISEHVKTAESIAFVDLHTGIGAFAEAVPLCFHDAGSTSTEALRAWHGSAVTAMGSNFPGGVAPSFTGVLAKELERMTEGQRLYALVIEFGTRPNADIITALMADRWLRFAGTADPARARELRYDMMDTFCPSDVQWRQRVVETSETIIRRTIDGLAGV